MSSSSLLSLNSDSVKRTLSFYWGTISKLLLSDFDPLEVEPFLILFLREDFCDCAPETLSLDFLELFVLLDNLVLIDFKSFP